MSQDTSRYLKGCSVCAIANTPRRLPEGKLVPLPIPERPWTHIGVGFMTDLPLSQGNTCVLVVVDRFSKSCKLIPLKGLPTAFEAAEALFHNVFHHFGIPEDIISDRGPQFISRVWSAFFRLLGVSVSLSSGYHPQTNGQTERKIQRSKGLLSPESGLLEPVPTLGRICTELPPAMYHRAHPLPMCPRIPASTLPMVG